MFEASAFPCLLQAFIEHGATRLCVFPDIKRDKRRGFGYSRRSGARTKYRVSARALRSFYERVSVCSPPPPPLVEPLTVNLERVRITLRSPTITRFASFVERLFSHLPLDAQPRRAQFNTAISASRQTEGSLRIT